MLTFLTLLLGIVMGPKPIELSAPAGTAAVELLLDGERVARRSGPPWTFVVDFGLTPAPHFLDAVARDARGVELGRVRQRVNLPKPGAEAVLALLPGKGGKGRAATLRWEGVDRAAPRGVTVSFDGKPLAAPNPERIELPEHVPERLHFLQSVVEFEDGSHAAAEITFGGRDRDETSRDLTAVLLRVPGGKPPAPEAMSGWLAARGEPLRVVATEGGEASIAVVLDVDGAAAFLRLKERSPLPTHAGSFRGQPEVRTVSAYGDAAVGVRAAYTVFSRSFPVNIERGLLHALAEEIVPWDGASCPRTADAATVAGLVAASWSHPRAVVVLLAGNADTSALSAAQTRSYLADLGVPVFVWAAAPAAPETAAAWGGGRAVRTRADVNAAVRELDDAVREQVVVWVEGGHLPQTIEVGAGAPAGVGLAR